MEFKELTEKDFKIVDDWNYHTEYECVDDNNSFSYGIDYYSGETPPINNWDGKTRYYAHISFNLEGICGAQGKSLEEVIDTLNQYRKLLIQNLLEVPNAKSD